MPCTFYIGVNGCKKGADCTYEHNWAAFSQAEKASRCKACGSKNHKAAECKAGTRVEDKAKAKAPRGPKGSGEDSGAAPSAPTGGDPGQQHIKSMLADAARFLQQVAPPPPASATQDPPVAAVPIPGAPAPPNAKASPTTPVQGTPVTLASISAQLETLRAMASDPQVRALEPAVTCEDGVSMAVMCENRASLRALVEEAEVRLSRTQAGAPDAPVALLDSGATHAVIPYEASLTNLERVPVTLAGDAKQEWWKTAGGTLVVPPGSGTGAGTSSTQVILPLGALVETLGCQVSWSKRRGLRVQHPTLGLLDTGVSSNTCPYVQERQALSLIAELECARLKDFSEQVQNLECQLEAYAQAPDPTTAIQGFIMGKTRKDALCALMAQPYFKDVSEDAKAAMAEAIPAFDDVAGKAALKDLPLKRAVRRTLQASSQWVVHLCAGKVRLEDPIAEWAQERNMPVLRVDLLEKGGKGWDLTKPQGAWRALLWAAAAGKIAVILSSPPQYQEGPRQRLHLQSMFLWSVASIARGGGIPYLAEHAGLPDSIRKAFESWSGTDGIRLSQGALGDRYERATEVSTNLDLRFLATLPWAGEQRKPPRGREWTVGFRQEIVRALSGNPSGPTCEELDQVIASHSSRGKRDAILECEAQAALRAFELEETERPPEPAAPVTKNSSRATKGQLGVSPAEAARWKAHLQNGHVPYRRDCRFCIEGAGVGIQHRKIKYPQSYTLSADLFGPVPAKEHGRDETCVSGRCNLKYALVGAFRVPRSAVEGRAKDAGVEDLFASADLELPEGCSEYAPSEPGPESQADLEGLLNGGDSPAGSAPHEPQADIQADEGVASNVGAERGSFGLEPSLLEVDDGFPTDPEALNALLKDLRQPVDQVVLRFVIPLKGTFLANTTFPHPATTPTTNLHLKASKNSQTNPEPKHPTPFLLEPNPKIQRCVSSRPAGAMLSSAPHGSASLDLQALPLLLCFAQQ